MFDTLLYAKKLEASGMTRDQAEAQVNVIAEMVVDGVATKQDLALVKQDFAVLRAENKAEFSELRLEMHTELSAVRAEMQMGFSAIRTEMQTGFSGLRNEMLVKMGAMFALSTSITIGVLTWVVK